MEKCQIKLEELSDKLKLVENFISLSLRREERRSEIQKLAAEAAEAARLLQKTKLDVLEVNKDYNDAIMCMQKTQLAIMQHLLKERRRKILEAEEDERDVEQFANKSHNQENLQGTNKLVASMAQVSVNKQCLTPKMTIYDYKESPFVKRSRLNPVSINFLDFEYHITPKIFESIPKYLRGREQLEELNNFLEHTIIACFNDKYQLMHRHRNVVRNPADKELWSMYNEQASYLPGRHFITVGDISHKTGRIVDKKSQNRIAMLRHIGVLQEQRVKQTICYVWSANVAL